MSVKVEEVERSEIPDYYAKQLSLTDHTVVCVEGRLFYKGNELICWLRKQVNLSDMWDVYEIGGFSQEEFMQFYRNIGYSLDGFDEIWGDVIDEVVNGS